ncbi:SusD/RagB family nutrient-binding outer membrane lipoprotein [Flavobacterium facile]|uniref:SusD/RagB family nutrient-binding outer membrane lipoprotein n=1 Tax=Flavobacterium facile TaxID=2893174 RepID=UPI002E77C157|nr:SusD/RagB family nutrient-binding outer membrane lipoprotein [Flavobacterium sp. T-12]
MKNLKIIVPVLGLLFASCDNYFDVNTNPNELLTAQGLPTQFLPAAELGQFRIQSNTMNRLGLLFSNATGGNVQSYASPFNTEFSLNLSTSSYSGIFEGLAVNSSNFQKIIDYNDPDNKYVGCKAIAKIYKVYNLQYLVDLYGNIPYSQAFQGDANLTPAYDDDQQIYKKLLIELDEARVLLADLQSNVYPNNSDLANLDIVLGGDYLAWEQFANTIELKMLLRMSKTTGATAAWRDVRLTGLAGKSFVSQDITINPGFNNSTDSQVNPFITAFGWDAAGNTTNRNLFCASGHIVKALNPYTSVNYSSPAAQEVVAGSGVFYPNVLDPRRSRLFSFAGTSPTSYQKGVTQGSTAPDVYYPSPSVTSTGQPSKFSPFFFNPHFQVAPGNASGLPNTNVGNFYANVDGYIMTIAESYFLQAEAAHLGATTSPAYAVLGLDASASFNAGVTATMSHYTAAIGTYLTTINTKPNFGYNAAFTPAQNYHAIMFQKWIALLNSNAIESYLDNTRTGYPLNPMPIGTTRTKRPYRLLYPTSEYIANANNVPNVSIDNIFDITNKYVPFWLQGDPALGQ